MMAKMAERSDCPIVKDIGHFLTKRISLRSNLAMYIYVFGILRRDSSKGYHGVSFIYFEVQMCFIFKIHVFLPT